MALSPYALKQAQAAFETNHIRPNPYIPGGSLSASQIRNAIDEANRPYGLDQYGASLVPAQTRYIEMEAELERLVCVDSTPERLASLFDSNTYSAICNRTPLGEFSRLFNLLISGSVDGDGQFLGHPSYYADQMRYIFSHEADLKAQQINNIRQLLQQQQQQQQQQRASRVEQQSGISQRHQTQQGSVRERQQADALERERQRREAAESQRQQRAAAESQRQQRAAAEQANEMRHQRMAQRDQRKEDRKQKQAGMEQERLRMKKALAER